MSADATQRRLSRLPNTGILNTKVTPYWQYPPKESVWRLIPPHPDVDELLRPGKRDSPRTAALIQENTNLRWRVADKDAAIAEMEREFDKLSSEHTARMEKLHDDRKHAKQYLIDTLHRADHVAALHMVEIAFLKLKYKADDDWLYQKKYKYSIAMAFPHLDMIQKLMFRAWAMMVIPGRYKRAIYDLMPWHEAQEIKTRRVEKFKLAKDIHVQKELKKQSTMYLEYHDDHEGEPKEKEEEEESEYLKVWHGIHQDENYVPPVRNTFMYEWLFATFHLWYAAMMRSKATKQRDGISGNMLWLKNRFFKELKSLWSLKKKVRVFGESMFLAKQEYLVQITFEIWKRQEPQQASLVNEEQAHVAMASVARCFYMWMSYIWAQDAVFEWGKEIYLLEADLPRIRSQYEQKVDGLERELSRLIAENENMKTSFEGDYIAHPHAPKPPTREKEVPKEAQFGKDLRRGFVTTDQAGLTAKKNPARKQSSPQRGSPRRSEVAKSAAPVGFAATPTSRDVQGSPVRKSVVRKSVAGGGFGAVMNAGDEKLMEEEQNTINISQLFRDPHGPLPPFPKKLQESVTPMSVKDSFFAQ
jgi:hypothetical protein